MPLIARSTTLALAAIAIGAAACSDADPLSKSHDIVARTVGHDLTVPQMTAFLASTKRPVGKSVENGVIIANLWSSYQRLGYAAAHDDSLESHFNAALAPAVNAARVNMLLDALRRPVRRDSATKAAYDAGSHGLYAVRHILFAFPPRATPAQRDSVITLATGVRRSLTPENFSALAKKYSSDTASAPKGGYLGIFALGVINPSAGKVIAALAPDSISKLLTTQLGLDIIQRLSWDDARADYTATYARVINTINDSILINHMSTAANLEVAPDGPNAARAAAANPVNGSRDSTVIATFDNGGKFTAANMVSWVNQMEPTARIQVNRDLPQQPDVVVTRFIQNVASRAVLLRAADSAGVTLPDTLRSKFHDQFRADLLRSWRELGVAPDQLADSAKTATEREQLAEKRVNAFIQRGMSGAIVLTPLSIPIQTALDAKYPTVLSTPALERVMTKS